MAISFKNQIPNHPTKCLGVTSPTYTKDQCRLCWLATYDRSYRRNWSINLSQLERVQDPEARWPCIHRGTEKRLVPGCGLCNGEYPGRECHHPQIASNCVITGTETFLNNVRMKGYRVCEDCGYRQSQPDLEMLPSQFRALIEEPPSALPLGWENWKVTPLAYKEAFLDLCDTQISPPSNLRDRGIIIGAGSETYFKCAWCVANHLRNLGCKLPIEFWYLGPAEMDPAMLRAAESIGITCVDALSLPGKKPRILAGWELKPYSVIRSRFAEVLYLDADSFPIRDPSYLFNLPEYHEKGAIFWPDLKPVGRTEWIPASVWEMWGLSPDSGPDLESGQFLVDKTRCWHELQVTMWLNEHSDWVYKHVYGDKSTYNLAWAGCDRDYVLPKKGATWESPIIYQYDLQGELIFQHACRGKQFLANGLEIPNLIHRNWPLEAIKTLSEHWGGKIYPETSGSDLGAFNAIWEGGTLPVNLRLGGTVVGGSVGFRRWYLANPDLLYLIDRGRVCYMLQRDGQNWTGGVRLEKV